ncbi:MMPL family transporter [Gordonia sp. HNM0687]|uniref:MMPL family transporter n=1 Tax=Gordonia mangrovi TaxID=2665643 RepID=A0A6L7GTT6_9ACTN|nr:MMPL family transporter [Gordonia mangrovi]MXP21918.1 MMPL family transporter [Gordonia mangrovi]UVF76282.1 MMPL family transporter [Gordonia mangrovi]
MFGAIGTFVFRMRFAVIAILIALMGGLGLYGLDLGKYLSQSGWFDPTSESVKGSVVADTALGRDHRSDVILLITPPEGTTVDDPEFGAKVENFVDDLIAQHGDIVNREDPGIIDPFYLRDQTATSQAAQATIRERTFTDDGRHAFISIGVTGDDDTTVLNNYQVIEPFFDDIGARFNLEGTDFELAGLQPVAGSMADGMDKDIHRAEVIALPLVAIMLFFIFGGVIAACLPVLIGGLTIAGSLGIMKILAQVTELNIFAQSVVTLIGLGIAIDYGLFIVSRFREELAEGYSTKAAVRRTVMTSGQTVVFSATIIVAALACLLIMPQGFLKSVAYGAIASVSLAAILSITVLPAILAILGPRIDALGLPFLRRTKTKEEVENGFWGRLAGWVMQHPVATAVPTVLLLLVLTIPFGGIKFGGISEAYLPPDNPNRVAQENFDEYFPTERTEEIKLVVAYDPNDSASGAKIQQIADEANQIPGFTKDFSPSSDGGALTGQYGDNGPQIIQMSAGLVDRTTAAPAIEDLRAIDTQGLTMWVAGTPTLTQDSIDALMSRLPIMAVLLVLVTGFLMFLAFGSLVLPIKAALMTALGLGATLGILTFVFVDGHGAALANFTPGPLFAAVLVLIIAIIFGLSTDYEIFLLSRMVEARQKGATTTEAVRVGTAYTGRIITAAAAILVVVTGAFGLSEIVMMKYIAYGMIAALILDATIIRMLLVPSVMKMLGDDCWWAPRWMRVMQQKIGLGETVLDDEPDEMRDQAAAARVRSAGTIVAEAPTSTMRAAPRSARGDIGVPAAAATGTATRGPARTAPRPAPDRQPPRRSPNTAAPQPAPGGRLPQAPVESAPARVTPTFSRAGRSRSNGPDTGGWSLGAGGIRLGNDEPAASAPAGAVSPQAAMSEPATPPAPPQPPRPATPPAPPAAPARPAGGPPADSALGRRPALDSTGKRPLAASLSPEAQRRTSRSQRSADSPMDRGLSNGTPSLTADQQSPGRSAPPDPADGGEGRRRATDRHARSDNEGDGAQISVQELLRRSRSENSRSES